MAVRQKKTKTGIVFYVETRGHWERIGSDKREAQRVNARRKKEAKEGTFKPKSTGAITVGKFLATWLDGRTNRSAELERTMMDHHVFTRKEFTSRKMEDLTDSSAVQDLVASIKKDPKKLAPKYIANIYGVVRTAFRAAVRQGVMARDVCMLEPGTISKKSKKRAPYSLPEARALTASAEGERLVWLALALYTGMRCGEVCGRRWRDWDPKSEPLGALTIDTQYNDQPLKGDDDDDDRPRRAPVHPDLAAVLGWWWSDGFELTYMRKPTPGDFIIERLDLPKENLTRSMTYKALIRDCAKANVKSRGQHATRHTFLTQARRASPAAKELAEKITHNAEGTMVDHYTHWEWEPLCSVISALPSFIPEHLETMSETLSAQYVKISSSSRTRTQRLKPNSDKTSKSINGEANGSAHVPAEIVKRAAVSCAVSESERDLDPEREAFELAVAEQQEVDRRGVRPLAKSRVVPLTGKTVSK